MTDPAPFLSTIAASSAAMVAIIGGLLVAKFVALDSEQQGAQHLLDEAKERLGKAQERERQARDVLRAMDVDYFFNESLMEKIYIKSILEKEAFSESDLTELKRTGKPGRLTDEDIAQEVGRRATEFPRAYEALGRLAKPNSRFFEVSNWAHFKREETALQDVELDDVWNTVFRILRLKNYSARTTDSLMGLGVNVVATIDRNARRYEVRCDDVDRAARVVEDLEAEVARRQKARDIIVRPKGLGIGLGVLAAFTVIGVIYPIWVMSRAPKDLTHSVVYPAFFLFVGGLVGLLGYMAWLALRLSGWRR